MLVDLSNDSTDLCHLIADGVVGYFKLIPKSWIFINSLPESESDSQFKARFACCPIVRVCSPDY